MFRHINIAFDKPDEAIAMFLGRCQLPSYNIHINQENYDIMIFIHKDSLVIGKETLDFPLLITDFVSMIQGEYYQQTQIKKE